MDLKKKKESLCFIEDCLDPKMWVVKNALFWPIEKYHYWVLNGCISISTVIHTVVSISWRVSFIFNKLFHKSNRDFYPQSPSVESRAIDFVTFSYKISIVKFSLNYGTIECPILQTFIFWKNLKGVRWSSAIWIECKASLWKTENKLFKSP